MWKMIDIIVKEHNEAYKVYANVLVTFDFSNVVGNIQKPYVDHMEKSTTVLNYIKTCR